MLNELVNIGIDGDDDAFRLVTNSLWFIIKHLIS